ncbi:AzlD domain-containing protein [Peptoanaerobacter stomatis]|jgi:hypothetical protein|uniref:Branched-chain amino acid transport protein AzlD n=1 Tax=Peptoanaerobacter stomatis TaxID=796937 RepID=G9XA09_9FIRM|nr:AzlD domain-containing protein [Peptoanaerobacter stomatis]EHL20255.1 hypothetical protein HMPREF9628_00100 [Peptoanaerobacter stomatis]EJU20497.1 branched-chain amino acid transport protein AzlD [Peptoanaerobacter stomatis]NWO25247.1 AzlD domain-containing protein [Peptostreptococcaceae bacterium oral taxon 081]
MKNNPYIYLSIMAIITYLIRVLPLTFIKKPIENNFIRSFLHYVPYVTLSVMTFPAILDATRSPIAGAISLVCGILLAWFNANMFQVSVACSIVVFIAEFIIL